ncbi:plasmalemma vesicle-associated protein isoform X2 [Rhineura floridana]|uniref:plasmalemma vesicle-associated protein isoform X2 n=1 Tax=Rhineura floridana TaxID=261503 RepID=UPI002AC882B3|nr:plasmalemma vesicle-associated protein isoform X2 [Rhineura floridana]
MENGPYAMAKLALEAKENPNKRDCGFYVKYFFLFLSLIQFLIILGLVLFMVYGNNQESTERHLQGLTGRLSECNAKAKALGEQISSLQRSLNASRLETRQNRDLAARHNNSLKNCNNEKTKVQELRRQDTMVQQVAPKLEALQAKLAALQLQTQSSQESLSRENKDLQERAKRAEKEKATCEIEKLEVQTRVQKYRELESKVLAKLDPVRENLRSATEQFLSSKYDDCYQVSTARQDFRSLSNTVQDQLESLSRQINQRVSDVTQENAMLHSQKASCAHSLQEQERELSAQNQQAEREKQLLREAHEVETKKLYAERQKTVEEKEALQLQTEQIKQACLTLNPAPPVRFPMIPGSSGGRLGSVGQPNSGSQGYPSTADRFRSQENRRTALENTKLPIQPPVISAGQPSA